MKYISQLPEPYKSLAEKRREEDTGIPSKNFSTGRLKNAFVWSKTPEAKSYYSFWHHVDEARSEQELPPIPEESCTQPK